MKRQAMSSSIGATAGSAAAGEDVWIPSVCYMCYNACSIKVHRVNGVVVKIEGDPESPHNQGRMCAKGNSGLMSLYNPHRLRVPLKRTNPRKGIGVDPGWVEITWDEALDTIAGKLKEVREDDPRGLLFSSWDHGLGPFGEAFATAFGTPNLNSGPAGVFCGNGLHPIAWINHGSFYLESDVDHCDYLILIGSQAGSVVHLNPMGIGPRMAEARLRGLKVVAVDPICSQAASKADEWIPLRPGTDAAFALGILNVLLNELGIYDRDFLRKYTNAPYLVGSDGLYLRDGESGKPLVWNLAAGVPQPFDQVDPGDMAVEGSFSVAPGMAAGLAAGPAAGLTFGPAAGTVATGFQLLKDHVRKYAPEKVEEITTIPAPTIRRIAREFGEAARIGSTIVIDGKELPYRPAHVDWSRGAVAHKHAMLTGVAIQLLNTVIGAVDVPGGHLPISAKGPGWEPRVGPDGLLVPDPNIVFLGVPYPPRKARQPETAELLELFPVSVYARSVIPTTLNEPEKYGLPYRVRMMLHCRNNHIMNTANPHVMAEAFSKIDFIATFAVSLDATAEMADIVLPEVHYLERLDPFPNRMHCFVLAAGGFWYWMMRQPVVQPAEGRRQWLPVLFELADRIGMRDEFYRAVNSLLKLKEPLALDPGRTYGWEEIVDQWCRSRFGEEHDLEWFKGHGFLTKPKTVEETYQRPFIKGRIPVYHEFFLRAGDDVRRVVEEMEIEWDTSDYQALPDWKPCPSYLVNGEHDLWAVNYKVPYHAQSYTYENAWLDDLTGQYPDPRAILINSATAAHKGIADGDRITVENTAGHNVTGTARVTEGIHPEVLGIMGTQGEWASGRPLARGKGVHFNTLIPYGLEYIDTLSGALDACVKVKIRKAG
ncbi:MAG: molybdopterin-dependent oxidoreductase [Firmicutes bacterium]|nr:molybdopterin-dependent oxidoreductase [Bacillota bacterium]